MCSIFFLGLGGLLESEHEIDKIVMMKAHLCVECQSTLIFKF